MSMRIIIYLLILITISAGMYTIFYKKDNKSSNYLIVDPDYMGCTIDSDCALIGKDCSGCGCASPINKMYLEEFQQRVREKCKNYNGAVCEYCCSTPFVKCINSECILSNLSPEGVEINPCR